MSVKQFVLGELFCGPGGMALGAKLARPQHDRVGNIFSIRHSWGVDIDEAAINTFNTNKLGIGICADVRDFVADNDESLERCISGYEKISALAFGFPCNDFSIVGKQKGLKGQFGELYKVGLEVLNRVNPDWFIAENVSGIESANSGDAFRQIQHDLSTAGDYGYELTTHLYKFEDYGVPQYRHRYIIVGIRKDLKLKFKVPKSTHRGKPITIGEALTRPLPERVGNTELTRHSERVVDRLILTPPGKNAWFLDTLQQLSVKEIRDELKTVSWYETDIMKLSDRELKQAVKRNSLNCTKARMSHIYRRLEFDRPAYTLTGSGGGGTHVYHWSEHRALTNRERARLQGFPDDFFFVGKKEQVRKQIGMAVSPPMAKIIFEKILMTFAGKSYTSEPEIRVI
ncbi:MAG TPA: DNA (cytosine-5-)-methyltransferase [Cyclobacteriaceae bacterium]|nr:DNA (cytosine-5-)-methyltransferase [Cyclobacteriaceae bacterium]